MSMHLGWDALNDYADGAMEPNARADAARHLDSCADCRQELRRLRAMLTAVADVPTSLEAPEGAWSAIRTSIETQKVVALPHTLHPTTSTRRVPLLAAAVLLIVASSATTVLIMNRGEPAPTVALDTAGPPAVGEALPASLVRMEQGYVNTVNELTAALNASRAQLAPETVRAVERSLKVIDDAIAEVREALVRDPASDVLRDVLSKNYQQKVDLLRRASARATTT